MRGLRNLVVVMGVMLVAGFAALVAAIAVRLSHRGSDGPGLAAFSAAPVELPRGARIEAVGAGAERIVMAIVLADGSRQLVVLDLASGRKLGTIPFGEAK